MRVTVLVENDSARPDLRAEHGLAMWIETGDHQILFDTGASDAVVANARTMGIDLESADAIVISHAHRDHTGGLAAVARVAGGATIIAGPGVTTPRYARRDEGLREIGLDHQTMNSVAHRLRIAQDNQRLYFDVRLVAGFPAVAPVPEDNRRLLVRGNGGMKPDPFTDELALLVETVSGAVLVTGCSHSGIGNIVASVLTKCDHLAGLIGGLHLNKEEDDSIFRVSDLLKDIPEIHAGHCTGDRAVEILQSRPGDCVSRFRTGSVIEFP